jgi:hypothetical protein
MRLILNLLRVAALAMTVLPACFLFAGSMPETTMRHFMLAGMIVWFAAALPLDKVIGPKRDH